MLTIRAAIPADNPALMALVKTGTGGAINRGQDFFARSRLYDRAKTFVAIEGDVIVGTVSRAPKPMVFAGREASASYLFDLDFHKPVYDEPLLERCREEDLAEGINCSYIQLLTGNPRAGFRFHASGFATDYNIWMSVLTPTPSPGGEIPPGVRTAVPSDYPEIAALLNHCYRDYNYFVPFTAASLRAMMERMPGFSPDSLYVYEDGSQLLACLGCLDYREVYRFVIITLGRRPREIYGPSQYLLPWLPQIDTPWNCIIPFPLGYRSAVEELQPLWRLYSRLLASRGAPGLVRFDQRDPLRVLERQAVSTMTTSPMCVLTRAYGDFALPGPERMIYADPRDL